MDEEKKFKWHNKHVHKMSGGHGHFYGFGVLASLFYFLQNANTLEAWIIGIVKSLVWPALVIYKVLELLKV
jgi:hypothetical protein